MKVAIWQLNNVADVAIASVRHVEIREKGETCLGKKTKYSIYFEQIFNQFSVS